VNLSKGGLLRKLLTPPKQKQAPKPPPAAELVQIEKAPPPRA
jgi:hypothetical protein